MNYQCVFHGVEQDAPASLRVREREDWPIEAGAPTLTEARRLVRLVRLVRVHYAELRTRRLCLGSGTNEYENENSGSRRQGKRKRKEEKKMDRKRKKKKSKVGNWWFTCAYTPSFKFFPSGLEQ